MSTKRSFRQTVFVGFQQIRGPFLILAVALVLVGAAVARHDGFWNWGSVCLLSVGVVCAHASVNLFNELSDFETGIDRRIRRTPFSGGSGLLPSGATSPRSVRLAAYGSLFVSAFIGLYFCLTSGWILLFFILAGGMAIRFYTSHLSKRLLGEIASGLTLGTFVVLGVYYSLSGHFTWEVVFISIPPGILTLLLLFLNEFPDAEADRRGGRRHWVIHFGKKKSAVLYAVGMGAVYVWISIAPWVVRAPSTILAALLTFPLALTAVTIVVKQHDHFEKMVLAQGLNTAAVVLTDLLMALGYFFST